jgi:AmmeMemoRadiSam system protein A
MENKLTLEEQKALIHLARDAIECRVKGEKLLPLDPSSLSFHLREQGASFITLTVHGHLRGCIGSLQPYQPLAEDVREHAAAAALEDPRFPPVQVDEINEIRIA